MLLRARRVPIVVILPYGYKIAFFIFVTFLYGVSRHICRLGDGSRTRCARPDRFMNGCRRRRPSDVRIRGPAPLRGRRVRRRPGRLSAARAHTHGHGHAHAGRLRTAAAAAAGASNARRGGPEKTKVTLLRQFSRGPSRPDSP